MNNTTVSNDADLVPLIHALATGFAGLFGAVSNAVAICVIAFSKPLRKPCYQLIAGASFGALVISLSYVSQAVMKLRSALGYSIEECLGWQCLLALGTASLFGVPFNAQVTCFVGLDRLVSLIAPIKYHSFGRRYVKFLLCLSAVVVLFQECVGFALSPLTKVVPCSALIEVIHSKFYAIYGGMNFLYCLANVIVYVAVLVVFHYRRAKVHATSYEYSNFMKQQTAIMPTIRLLMLLYLLFGVLPEILFNVGLKPQEGKWNASINTTVAYLKLCNCFVEVTALTLCCKKFRQCLKMK